MSRKGQLKYSGKLPRRSYGQSKEDTETVVE